MVRDYVRRNIAFLRQEVSKIAGMTVFETMVFFYTIVAGPQHPDAPRLRHDHEDARFPRSQR